MREITDYILNVLILTSDDPYKNSGVVARGLLEGLRLQSGYKVKLLVGACGDYHDPDIVSVTSRFQKKWDKTLRKLRRIVSTSRTKRKEKPITDPDYYIFDYDFSSLYFPTKRILQKAGFIPDAIIVLFMTKFLTYRNLYELNKITQAPVFLYCMDMAPMTGGCHYAWDCKGYAEDCNECPAFLDREYCTQAKDNLSYNQAFIEKANIIPVAGSEWQFRQLEQSTLFRNRKKYKALLSISETQYFQADKRSVRQELGLPMGKKILFFGAVSAIESRKGAKELVEALQLLEKSLASPSSVHLAIAGNNIAEIADRLPFSYTKLGYLDHMTMPKAYQAADIFVSPSIEDSGPMMVNQSIMCGTPVVAFDLGVALDLVRTNETGYRAKLKDTRDFSRGIEILLGLRASEYIKMSNNCRALGLETFTPAVFLSRFGAILDEN